MPKMTKPQLAKHSYLEGTRDLAVQVIYNAAAPRTDIRFNDCYEMASIAVQEAYQAALEDLETFRQDMINQGRAYRCNTFGHFTPNWR